MNHLAGGWGVALSHLSLLSNASAYSVAFGKKGINVKGRAFGNTDIVTRSVM